MRRRCILHVGVPKTGTTHLQDVLWGSTQELREQGARLAMRSVDDHFFLTLALRDRLDPEVDSSDALDVVRRLRRDVHSSRPEHLIVSHELLAPVSQGRIDELMDLLGDLEVHVVVTARDLARQIPAEWQQQVKTRAQVPYFRFVDRVVAGQNDAFWSAQDLPAVAGRWGRGLPPERVHIVTVPPAGSPREVLLARFCDAVGLSPEGLNLDRARLNESIGFEQTELLRRVNIALGDRLPHVRSGYGGTVKFGFAEQVLAQQEARQRLRLPPQHMDWCIGAAKEMVVHLEHAGYAVHGDLADLIPHPSSAPEPYRPTDAEVAAAAVDAIATMLDEQHSRELPAGRRRHVREHAGRLTRGVRRSVARVARGPGA